MLILKMVSAIFVFRTITNLDYETFSEFRFQVNVRDSGQPSRSAESPAEVIIKVISISTKFFSVHTLKAFSVWT